MTVFKGMGFYHVEAANTNRFVTFRVAAQAGVSNCFTFLKGNNAFHPWVGQISAPTANQLIAQYRVDNIVRRLCVYAIPISIAIIDFDRGGAETANAVTISYETLVSNYLPSVSDIVDTLGMADRAAKTKLGLQSIATAMLATASLDGGGTLLFAVNPSLADGTTSTAPAITSLTVAKL
jgi:hypothetical protein